MAFPDDVQNDVLEMFVPVMAMRPPAAGTQVNFHVTRTRRFVTDLQNGAGEIRPAFDADKSGMKDADGSSIGGFELVAAETLVLPDGLEQALGR